MQGENLPGVKVLNYFYRYDDLAVIIHYSLQATNG